MLNLLFFQDPAYMPLIFDFDKFRKRGLKSTYSKRPLKSKNLGFSIGDRTGFFFFIFIMNSVENYARQWAKHKEEFDILSEWIKSI
jgi:hypothetical protein